ncbi:melatonin receptor type 1B-B [Nematostella vectensis]|uniref:melatonin receptor type 1B-B n=1 Tax=Nematostella vectensis TaxID=45351 RepID=UPI002077850E|nr:melatonin receptor type 1B-B [Nematostella vectensis]
MNISTGGTALPINVELLKTVFVSEACLITCANLLALVVFLRKSFRVKKSTYFLLSMTVADFQVGLTFLINCLGLASRFAFTWSNFASFVSLFSLVFIALERTYAVFLPFSHRSSQTRSYLICIALLWALSFAIYFLPSHLLPPFAESSLLFFRWSIVSGASLCLAVITICYISIWIKMRFGKRFDDEQASRNNAKLAKTLCIVTFTTVGCFLPIVVMLSCNCYHPIYFPIMDFFIFSNSFWNVLLYTIRIPEFRKELRDIVKLCASCNTCAHPRCCRQNRAHNQLYARTGANQVPTVICYSNEIATNAESEIAMSSNQPRKLTHEKLRVKSDGKNSNEQSNIDNDRKLSRNQLNAESSGQMSREESNNGGKLSKEMPYVKSYGKVSREQPNIESDGKNSSDNLKTESARKMSRDQIGVVNDEKSREQQNVESDGKMSQGSHMLKVTE